MTKISKLFQKQIVLWVVLFALTVPVLLPLTRPGFFPTQDYIYVARLYQMDKALKDGQFPVRWAPDFRYGEPLFNFYAPLPYYVGSLIKTFGFSYLETIKLLFALSFFLPTVAMFYLAKEFFGKLGGTLAAVLYLYAPYHSVDVYVRGALSEAWSLIFLPLIFLSSLKLAQKPTLLRMVFLALSLAGLFYTHNIMSLLFMPFVLGWMVFWVIREKQIKPLPYFAGGLILGAGLASSYLWPALLEKQFVQSQYLLTGYFNFRGHFVAVPEWFSTFWGYGASLWGPKDDMSFQVGVVHWAALALSLLLAGVKRNKTSFLLVSFLAGEFLFSLFMQHNQSAPVWELFSILAFVQFPWRFLGISIFLVSFIGGSLVWYAPKKVRPFLVLGFILAVIAFNVGYFRPESYYLDSIDSHFIAPSTLSQDDKLPKDYLPVWVKKIAPGKISGPQVLSGQALVSNFSQRSSSAQFEVNVKKESQLELPVTYFPGWTVWANGKAISLQDPDELGLVRFDLPSGKYTVKAEFANTPVRVFGNTLSLASLIAVLALLLKVKRKTA